MPQGSIYYAIGRISVLMKDTLDQNRLDRLLQAGTVSEAKELLSDFGWPAGDEIEQITEDRLTQTVKLVRSITTDESMLKCFLYRYDVNNLKILLKARCLGTEHGPLSACGTVDRFVLEHAVNERRYKVLPPVLCDALDEIEKQLSVMNEVQYTQRSISGRRESSIPKTESVPLMIDLMLDRAMYRMIFEATEKNDNAVRRYFTGKADILNLVSVLRSLHMGKDHEFIRMMLIPYGTVTAEQWIKAAERPEKLPLLVQKYGTRVYHTAIAAQEDHKKLPVLEKEMDNWLTAVFSGRKGEVENPERILTYLLRCEREAAAVRLILTGKANGFNSETIRERLRDLNV